MNESMETFLNLLADLMVNEIQKEHANGLTVKGGAYTPLSGSSSQSHPSTKSTDKPGPFTKFPNHSQQICTELPKNSSNLPTQTKRGDL